MHIVSEKALVSRINRALRPDGEMLRKARSDRWRLEFGEWYVHNVSRNYLAVRDVDIEELGRDLGVLKSTEQVSAC